MITWTKSLCASSLWSRRFKHEWNTFGKVLKHRLAQRFLEFLRDSFCRARSVSSWLDFHFCKEGKNTSGLILWIRRNEGRETCSFCVSKTAGKMPVCAPVSRCSQAPISSYALVSKTSRQNFPLEGRNPCKSWPRPHPLTHVVERDEHCGGIADGAEPAGSQVHPERVSIVGESLGRWFYT